MDQQHLINMANQIGQFFESLPERNEALMGIADHIKRFWEPRMRRELLAAFDTPELQAGFSEVVRAALTEHRELLAD